MDPRQLLLSSLFETAVAAADPAVELQAHLPAPPKGRTVVVGAGARRRWRWGWRSSGTGRGS
jgi:hydroxypyruvate reductase